MKYYVTYGWGTNLRNCYSTIEAFDYEAARIHAKESIDNHYAFMYDESSKKMAIDAYNLEEVPLQIPTARED